VRIVLTSDHNGVVLKSHLAEWLVGRGHSVECDGADSEVVVDYPLLCLDACNEVRAGRADLAIVVGGSGQGEVIACNKVAGIRAGLAHTRFATEISRGHNDANVMVLGAKVIDVQTAEEMVELWLTTPFKGGVHQRRLEQIADLELWA
jgi:ribose 5-phosphate isomerase B